MNVQDERLSTVPKEAAEFVKKSRKLLIEKFANSNEYTSVSNPFTIFMAGSPGAGKTEFSIAFREAHILLDPKSKPVRIDADEIRWIIPQFTGGNSQQIQFAASIGVEKLFDYVQEHNYNAIIDGTFSSGSSLRNVERALKRSRKVGIFYLYQDPVVAWEFTKKREKIEGRNIPRHAFVKSFISARENVDLAKDRFGSRIELHLVVKNYENRVQKTYFNIDKLENYLKKTYTTEQLEKELEC